MRSWKSEVITNNEGDWVANRLRFASLDEASNYVRDLAGRWSMVSDIRAVPSNDPVSHRYIDGELYAVVPFLIPHPHHQHDAGETA